MSEQQAPTAQPSVRNRSWEWMVRHQGIVVPLLGVLIAFGIGAILIGMQGVDPSYAYRSLFRGAFVSDDGLLRTLQKATPLIFSGLAVTIAFRVGLFNIGAQGQLLVGALASAVTAVDLNGGPAAVVIVASMIAGIIAGALWAAIAGLLKAYRNVHEVIATIMLNAIAMGVIDFLVGQEGPFGQEGAALPRTPDIAEQYFVPNFGPLTTGFIISCSLAVGMWWLLRSTTLGFRFNTVGKNKFAAVYAGMSLRGTILLSMLFSGGLAGLGGTIETLGVTHHYENGFNAGLGFDGITIALLARANPLATIPAAVLVGSLRAGAATLQFDTGIQPEIVDLILATVLLLVSIPVLGNAIFRDRAVKNEAITGGWGA